MMGKCFGKNFDKNCHDCLGCKVVLSCIREFNTASRYNLNSRIIMDEMVEIQKKNNLPVFRRR